MSKGIVLFDGLCNFCDSSVQFIMKRDHNAHFQFASIQSDLGQQLLKEHGLTEVDSIVVINNENAFTKSNAAIEIAKYFKGLWKILVVVKVVPKPFRDMVYDWIARNRYKWFGQKDACRIPTPEERERFLS